VSELQHPDARSFEEVAEIYERARPGYPSDAVAWFAERLGLHAGRTVLDLGAGTGKLTRALVDAGARVIAVEPGDAMRAVLERELPNVEAHRGSAESIPLPDDAVDVITVGQAFHWFRHDEAVPEMHRVLRPGGGVGLIWNARDDLPEEIVELVERFVPPDRPGPEDWPHLLAENGLFGPLEERTFPFSQRLDADGLVERMCSISFVAAAPPEDRRRVDAELRAVVARLGGTVDFSYVTRAYVSFAA
jgi:ubiquinone/menaquinone biosynthesis C-methylase UbiE